MESLTTKRTAMKKIYIAFSVAAFLFSCGKDHVCSCTQHFSTSDSSWTKHQADTIVSGSNNKAEKTCNGLDSDPITSGPLTAYLDCEVQ